MDQKKLLALQGHHLWIAVQLNAQLVMQIAKAPQIVVADEQMHRDAGIGKLGQLALNTHKASRNH